MNRTDGVKKIIPERLKQARLYKGLSLDEAAQLLEVSPQSVSQYEREIITPKPAIIDKYTEKFGLPYLFFMKEIDRPSSTSLIFYRSLASASKTAQKRTLISHEWLWEIFSFLSHYIEFPKLNIPEVVYTSKREFEEIDISEIEEVAMKLRDYWELGRGPINNLTAVLERNGFVITKKEFEDLKTDGFSQWKEGRPYIFISEDKNSAVRIRYDIAHELGHIILHSEVSEDELNNNKRFLKIEKEAHCFAGAFLLPSSTFSEEVFSSSVQNFIPLKRRWKVSIAAMVKRCEDLHLFSEAQILNIRKYMSKNHMHRQEPLDDTIPIENPCLLKQAIEILEENKIITSKELLEDLCFPSCEIEALCELPSGYFKEYDEKIPKLRPNLRVVK
jgi:Zn-dependent peptidase ImmA (M78 family)/transcriptional regulator with XRE-family HTH domain